MVLRPGGPDPHERVLAALEGVSRRTLARRLAASNGGDNTPREVEQWRRLIYRVIEGKRVSDPEKRQLLAETIGVDPDDLAPVPGLRGVPRSNTDRLARIEERLDELHGLRSADADDLAAARSLWVEEAQRQSEVLMRIAEGLEELREWTRRADGRRRGSG